MRASDDEGHTQHARSVRVASIASLTALSLVLVACGTSATSSTHGTTGNVGCSLLSTEQVEGIMGGHVSVSSRPSECDYVVKPGTYLSVSAGPLRGHSPSFATRLARYGPLPGDRVSQLAGHTVLWTPFPFGAAAGGQLTAVVGANLVFVQVAPGGPDPLDAAQSAMTQIIVGRSNRH
jgi:hypothetical protein